MVESARGTSGPAQWYRRMVGKPGEAVRIASRSTVWQMAATQAVPAAAAESGGAGTMRG
jgi:hypothetical protein